MHQHGWYGVQCVTHGDLYDSSRIARLGRGQADRQFIADVFQVSLPLFCTRQWLVLSADVHVRHQLDNSGEHRTVVVVHATLDRCHLGALHRRTVAIVDLDSACDCVHWNCNRCRRSGKVSLEAKDFAGNLLMLGAAMLWASGTVISGPLLKQISPLRLAFFSSLLTTPMHLLWVSPKLVEQLANFKQTGTFMALIYSGAFSTGIAYATWHVGVRRLGGSHAAVYQNVVTLVAVLGGWFVLNEPLLQSQIFGGVLMLIGLYLMRKSRARH